MRRTVFTVLALLILAVLVSLRQWPPVEEQGRDSGAFAYTGAALLNGEVPYRDVWDHKPPLVYVFNAVAFALLGANRWALWLLEVTVTFGTGVLFWALLRAVFQRGGLALAGGVIFLLQAHHFVLVGNGNYTETYALLGQVMCLWAGWRFGQRPTARAGLLVGISAGLIFLTRQNSIGVALAFAPALLLHPALRADRLRGLAVAAAGVGAGGLAVLGAAALAFAACGALDEALDAVIVAPAMLHTWFADDRIGPGTTVCAALESRGFVVALAPLLPFALAGIVLAGRRLARRTEARPPAVFFAWVALTFGLDLVLVNLSSAAYNHYFITPMPAFVLLVTLALDALTRPAKTGRGRRWRNRAVFAAGVYLVLFYALLYWFLLVLDLAAEDDPFGSPRLHPLTGYVREHTDPDDYVLVWGAASEIYFQADRRSPSRYHYSYPLVVADYAGPDVIAAFVAELRAHPPRLIADVTGFDNTRVPPLDAGQRAAWLAAGGRADTSDLTPLYDLVAGHCAPVHEADEMRVYACAFE